MCRWPDDVASRDTDQVCLAAATAPPPLITFDRSRRLTRSGDLAAVLSAVARDTLELLGGPEIERTRECGRPRCTCLFVDSSRGKPRRWCGMGECGNRIKDASYRQRQRQDD